MALDHGTRETFIEKANGIIDGVNGNGMIDKEVSIAVIQQFIAMTRRVIAVYFRKVNELDNSAGGEFSLYNNKNADSHIRLWYKHNDSKIKETDENSRKYESDEFLQYMGMVTAMESAALQYARRVDNPSELGKILGLLRDYFAEIIDPSLKGEQEKADFLRPDYLGGRSLQEFYNGEKALAA